MWRRNRRKQREKQYRALVQPHVPQLLNIALQRTGNQALAEDLVQESCITAWESLERLEAAQAARAWLVRILLRRIADHTRTQGRRQGLMPITDLEEAHWQAIASEDQGPFEQTLAAQSDERIARLLRELPRDFAIVVELHDLLGYCYREIAEALDIPQGTVMSRLSRGRRLLAVSLTATRQDEPATPSSTRRNRHE